MAEMMKEVVVVEPHKYEVREVEIPELALRLHLRSWHLCKTFMLKLEVHGRE